MQAQIIGTSAESNVAPSVLITFDNVKLLFNAGIISYNYPIITI